MEDLIGKVIENYKFESLLGRGGMGVVYKAYDLKLDRYVAIKILDVKIVDKPRFVERFKREAKNQAQLSHPNIVTVYGFIESGDFLGIVMEYVEGESLDKLLYRQKKLHIYDAVFILRQILLGIGFAHSKGFIHRDIKPSNIIVNKEGVAKIMDFGISKSLFEKGVTKTGAKIGTVYYMSPEQIKGEDVTHHTDIYSIGCTFYEMLIGEPPFKFENEYDVMDAHLKKELPKVSSKVPGAPELVDKIIALATKKKPSERYAHCEEFLKDLTVLEKQVLEIQTKLFQKVKKNPRKTKIYSIIAFSGFIVVMLLLSYFVYNQVNDLLKSKQLKLLKKYSIQTLFQPSTHQKLFSKISGINLNTNIKLNSISMNNRGLGIVVGDSGNTFISKDYGITWNNFEIPDSLNLYDATVLENGRSFLVGESSAFYYSANNLSDFRKLTMNGNYALTRISFVDSLTGFVLGSKGLILKTVDGGINWEKMFSPTKNLLYDINFINRKTGFIVGWKGTILKTTDRGITWIKIKSFTNKYLKSIDFFDEDIGLIVGGNLVYRTDNGGKSWDRINISEVQGFQKVKFMSKDVALIVGGKGAILFSLDKGISWKLLDSGTYANFNDLLVTKNNGIFVTGVNGTLLHLN